MPRTGVYPGSFNPLTVAHLAIAEAAVDQHGLDRLELVISRVALAKEDDPDLAPVEARVAEIEALGVDRPWLAVAVTDAQLLADIAEGHDVLVLGADKWAQVNDPRFYGDDPRARDAALARLPALAIAPRPPHPVPDEHALDVPAWVAEVSATAVRAGRHDWRADPPDRPGRPRPSPR